MQERHDRRRGSRRQSTLDSGCALPGIDLVFRDVVYSSKSGTCSAGLNRTFGHAASLARVGIMHWKSAVSCAQLVPHGLVQMATNGMESQASLKLEGEGRIVMRKAA